VAVTYPKKAIICTEQIERLKKRGLEIPDVSLAEHILSHNSYYRLSAYRFPFTPAGSPDSFKPGVTFEDIWALYSFDGHLRSLVFEAVGMLEVSVRSRWALEVGVRYDPFAYERPSVHTDPVLHAKSMETLDSELRRSKGEPFLAHFAKGYGTLRPPIWMIIEIMTIGRISSFYSILHGAKSRQRIADPLGVDEKVLKSFLHHATEIRNVCAHHSRLWNRKFTVSMLSPNVNGRHPALVDGFDTPHGLAPNLIYNALVMLSFFTARISGSLEWRDRLVKEIKAQPTFVSDGMGFPCGWETRHIWSTPMVPV
jgi:abortive infection bacteriophage resistance protein